MTRPVNLIEPVIIEPVIIESVIIESVIIELVIIELVIIELVISVGTGLIIFGWSGLHGLCIQALDHVLAQDRDLDARSNLYQKAAAACVLDHAAHKAPVRHHLVADADRTVHLALRAGAVTPRTQQQKVGDQDDGTDQEKAGKS